MLSERLYCENVEDGFGTNFKVGNKQTKSCIVTILGTEDFHPTRESSCTISQPLSKVHTLSRLLL